MNNWIGISLGDITGISTEVTLKALAAESTADSTRFLLIGDRAEIQRRASQAALELLRRALLSNGAAS